MKPTGAGQRRRPKRDDHYFRVQPLELILMLTQLCHVLSAAQSAQVAQEHQKDVVPSRDHAA